MPTYQYQGRNLDGSATKGSLEAVNEDVAAETLINKGIIPTSISEGASGVGMATIDWKELFCIVFHPLLVWHNLFLKCHKLLLLKKR